MAERIGDWIQTYTGKKFYPLDPRPEEICIEDIAHSLSLQCRFAGHCKFHYSVAQHSLLVADIVAQEHKLWALLHDAAEAYLVDLPRPIKHHSELGGHYMEIESRLEACIALAFELPPCIPIEVKNADNAMVMAEKRDIMSKEPKWEDAKCFTASTAASVRIYETAPSIVEHIFLDSCAELTA